MLSQQTGSMFYAVEDKMKMTLLINRQTTYLLWGLLIGQNIRQNKKLTIVTCTSIPPMLSDNYYM